MIKKLYCPKCEVDSEICLSEAGPHIKASCNVCGAYIKFMSQIELTGENKMAEFEVAIKIPNSKYGEEILINKYGDQYSLVSGGSSKTGDKYMKWCFPQDKDRLPRDKAVPWKINLGERSDAIEVIKQIAKAFGMETRPIG